MKAYFDTIPHDQLIARLRGKISDGRLLDLIESLLKAKILAEARKWTPAAGGRLRHTSLFQLANHALHDAGN